MNLYFQISATGDVPPTLTQRPHEIGVADTARSDFGGTLCLARTFTGAPVDDGGIGAGAECAISFPENGALLQIGAGTAQAVGFGERRAVFTEFIGYHLRVALENTASPPSGSVDVRCIDLGGEINVGSSGTARTFTDTADVLIRDPGNAIERDADNAFTVEFTNPSTFDITAEADDDYITASAAHLLTPGDPVIFPTLVGGVGLTADVVYYVAGINPDDPLQFQVSATLGGPIVNISTDYSDGTGRRAWPNLIVAIFIAGN